jgi:DNA topoisomerase-1
VLNGRYGPYITDKQRNARIPKERDPKTLTLEECRALLAAAPQRPGRGRFGKKTPAKTAKKAATKPAGATATTDAPAAPAKPKAKAKAKKKAKSKGKVKAATKRKTAAAGGTDAS